MTLLRSLHCFCGALLTELVDKQTIPPIFRLLLVSGLLIAITRCHHTHTNTLTHTQTHSHTLVHSMSMSISNVNVLDDWVNEWMGWICPEHV